MRRSPARSSLAQLWCELTCRTNRLLLETGAGSAVTTQSMTVRVEVREAEPIAVALARFDKDKFTGRFVNETMEPKQRANSTLVPLGAVNLPTDEPRQVEVGLPVGEVSLHGVHLRRRAGL